MGALESSTITAAHSMVLHLYYGWLIAAASVLSVYAMKSFITAYKNHKQLRAIPAIGPSGILSSYLGAIQFLFNGRQLIQEGYERYPRSAFRVPTLSEWIVVVSNPSKIDDVKKASEDALSFRESLSEILQIQFTLGQEIHEDAYHVAAIRSPLTRNIAACFPELHDEMICSFQDLIPTTDDWHKVEVLPAVTKITSRVSNRFFIGLPLCREPEYRDINIQFAVDVVMAATKINLLPGVFKPWFGHLLTSAPQSIRRTMHHLTPIIEERIKMTATYGKDWEGKPNDLISWLLEFAEGHQRSVRDLTLRVLTINFGAINTTAMAFTRILIDLATHSEFVAEMREEVENVLSNERWSKTALHKLHKVDSFIKESQRMGGSEALLMHRKTLQDFTFSDGLVIPKGNSIAVPNMAIHHDKNVYVDPERFDGFRFLRRADENDTCGKHSMVALSTDYIVFGNGRNACPGRFFAVTELKAFVAHVLMKYDIALDPDNLPETRWHKFSSFPDPKTTLLFRKRRLDL